MQQLTQRLKVLWISGIATATAVGCSPAATLPGQPEPSGVHLPSGIAQIVRPTVTIQSLSPAQNSETVHVKGTVMQQAPLLTGGLYQVQDDSGTIWVLSSESAPPAGTSVSVIGTLEVEAIAVEGIDISDFYLRETSRTSTMGDDSSGESDVAEPNPDAEVLEEEMEESNDPGPSE